MSLDNISKIKIIRFLQSFHLYIHAYALILLGRGLTLVQITALESIVIAVIFLMEIPTGVIADRIGRKWSIVAAIFFMMSAEALFLVASSYPVYIVVSTLTGIGFAFASGAIEAIVYDSLPPENRETAMKRAMGSINSWARIAFFIAPIVGAIIMGDLVPSRTVIAIGLTATVLLVAVLISLTLQEPADEWEKEKANSLTILREGIAELRANVELKRLMILVIFTTPFTSILIVTLAAPYLALNNVSPFVIGLSLSLGSLMGVFTQRYAYKFEEILGQDRAIWILLLLPGVMYWLLAGVSGAILPVIIIILMYGTNDMKTPLFSAYQNSLIASKNRATVLSLMNMFLNLFVAIVAPIYAAIGTTSLTLTFVIMGSVIIIATLILGVPKLSGDVD